MITWFMVGYAAGPLFTDYSLHIRDMFGSFSDQEREHWDGWQAYWLRDH